MVSKPAAFAYCTAGVQGRRSRARPRVMRLRVGPSEPAIDCVTGAEDRGCLLVGNFVRNQIGSVSIHQHILCVASRCVKPCAFQIRAEHPAAALAPFTASTRGLNPCGAHTVAYLSRGDFGRYPYDFADRLVTEDPRKLSWNVSERFVYVGIADTACAHLHQYLTGSRLGLGNIFDLQNCLQRVRPQLS